MLTRLGLSRIIRDKRNLQEYKLKGERVSHPKTNQNQSTFQRDRSLTLFSKKNHDLSKGLHQFHPL